MTITFISNLKSLKEFRRSLIKIALQRREKMLLDCFFTISDDCPIMEKFNQMQKAEREFWK